MDVPLFFYLPIACPEPGGIFPDQGSIENTLSPASSAGGFFTTGPPGRDIYNGLLFSHVKI